MNIQEYISSGIIESYVLGMADAAEREEFERMCGTYPEVRQARDRFEAALEDFSMANQTAPPKNLKSKIFASIDIESTENKSAISEPVFRSSPGEFSMERGRLKTMDRMPRYLAAASVILLLISTALNFYFFNKYREYDKRYEALVISQSALASHNDRLQTRLVQYENALNLMKSPDMAIVKMPAIPNGPDPASVTTVYWDTNSKDVYLAVNKLPVPAPGQQYQLWAMVDGRPVDAGVFDMTADTGVMKMKNIPRAQAFAITLEKKGGSATPTMEKLYVLGKV